MVKEILAARGILVEYETVRQLKFNQSFAIQIRRRLPAPGDKWDFDEVALSVAGTNIASGAWWTRMGPCSTSWFSADATWQAPSVCS